MPVIQNTVGKTPPAPPTRDDGSLYAFEMIFDDGKLRAYGDTAAELLEHLIEDYDHSDEASAGQARVRHAVGVQVSTQPYLTFTDAAALANLSDAEWAVLNGSRVEQPAIDRWDAPIDLILIDLWYQPFGSLAVPVDGEAGGRKRIHWLCTVDELGYLKSLAEVGYINLAELPPGT
ncbi:MAG: hypothetical protein ACYDGN_16175 [Acidimicrobiales bacterium]